MSPTPKREFLREYSRRLADGTAALFIGAGMSCSVGYVNWRDLLREVADDLGLDVDIEHDLVAVAQYHENRKRSRAKLNEKLLHEFTKNAAANDNHTLIARLPVRTVWTTNYDHLLEEAFKREEKQVDAKITAKSLATYLPGTDVTIYKMHGDVLLPNEAVLTKDDYERYEQTRGAYSIRLRSDLITQTFLFLGFSFDDPNIEYILSRVRLLLEKDVPPHYCLMRAPQLPAQPSAEEIAKYDYARTKLALRIDDLKRFGIQTVLIDDYSEVTEILRQINESAFAKNIFVSGSAEEGVADFDKARLELFARKLGTAIIDKGYNIISGYGLGIGSDILAGALEKAYTSPSHLKERLMLRPFPITIDPAKRKQVFTEWRQSMISQAGFSIFLAGNKRDSKAQVIMADGVIEEFDIAKNQAFTAVPIPIGATGWAARKIWDEVRGDQARFYGNANVSTELQALGDAKLSDQELLKAVFSVAEKVKVARSR
ncbi:MAG TPA: SIR2 family protein [bacterium]|jgi:hypothetical protein